ncbi:ABC transporter substrate-binding protein [Thalassoglobus sp. JC818]|uniref:ABC transporter substrate-binding protein n=1 Tax=Thalassoglobus sp. JC818 TaxID=3232136 RepID=UPI00345B1066
MTRWTMKHLPFTLLFLLIISGICIAQSEEEEALPTLEEMTLPTAEQLLNDPPKDWVVLNTGGVLTVESVNPRPDTLALRQAEIEAKEEERRRLPVEQRDRLSREIDDLNQFFVSLPNVQGNPEFKFPLRRIVEIIHHEDLMIRRIKELLKVDEINPALELLTRLQRTRSDWPGLNEVYIDLLFVDTRIRVDNGDYSSSLMLIDELLEKDKTYGGIPELAGRAISGLTQAAIDRNDYLSAQFYLSWLENRFPNHSVYDQFSGQLSQKVESILAKADEAGQTGEHREAAKLVDEAVSIWPRTPGLRGPHRVHSERFQRLKVGVIDAPGECDAYFIEGPADRRKAELTELNLFEVDRLRDGTAYYWTRFFDEWEPTDLGREMRFKLKQFRQPYEMQAIVSVTDIVTHLINRLNPDHPNFDERLSAYVNSVEVISPTEFSLAFKRVPPRIEPLLAQITVGNLNEDEAIGPITDPGGFRMVDEADDQTVYLRKLSEPEGLQKYHVAEVLEQKYESYEKAAQGLVRGEVSMLPELPDRIIRRMQADEAFMKKFFVLQYMMPETHVLQFNPASTVLRNRELRTALAYAVNRERLLREVVLQDPKMAHGRLATTPFFASNPGRNLLVEPRRHDLSAAVAMLLASKKQLKDGIPPLTMIVAPGPVEEEVARDIARVWNKIGLQVNLVYAHEPKPASWDILYRRTQIPEPLVQMWPFLSLQPRAKLSDLDHYPDWLKQELVQLDRTSDQSRAITALQTLHRHLWYDTSVFPLWELDRFVVIRKNVQGFPQRPLHCYDRIDRWTIDAWYETELP